MEAMVTTGLILAVMGAVVLVFRTLVRRPAGVMQEDPPGVRTLVVFAGEDRELFCDDRDDEPYVGVRLFHMMCDGLAAGEVRIENRGTIQNAQRAECVVEEDRLAIVLEWIEARWVASIEWVARTPAERRHLALTQQVFSPADTPALRRVLVVLDGWLKRQPALSDVKWYRKEKWIAEDTADPGKHPLK